MSNTIVLLRAVNSLTKHILRGFALTALAAAITASFEATLDTVPWEGAAYDRHPTFYNWLIVVLALLLLFWPLLTAGLLVLYRRKTRDKSVRKEADKWLARQRTESLGTMRQDTKIERRTLWGPTVLVLLIFLFFPETMGIISHVFRGWYLSAGPYRIAIPLTWTIVHKRPSGIWVLYAKGIAREGFRPYWYHKELESVGFGAIALEERPNLFWYFKYATVVSAQNLRLGNQTFVCYDVLWHPHRAGEVISPDTTYVDLECRTENRDFTASFSGERAELPTFYHVLETMRGP